MSDGAQPLACYLGGESAHLFWTRCRIRMNKILTRGWSSLYQLPPSSLINSHKLRDLKQKHSSSHCSESQKAWDRSHWVTVPLWFYRKVSWFLFLCLAFIGCLHFSWLVAPSSIFKVSKVYTLWPFSIFKSFCNHLCLGKVPSCFQGFTCWTGLPE